MEKRLFTYAGIMEPMFAADKFATSIFKDDAGDHYVQNDTDDETIGDFKRIHINRPLISPVIKIDASIGDAYIYSFQTNTNQLLYGDRESIEYELLPLHNSPEINVHAKLMISSFLKLYQRTLDLVEESNWNLKQNGIEQTISKDIVFSNTTEPVQNAKTLLNSIYKRFDSFKKIDDSIRIEDIAFVGHNKAFFIHHHLEISLIVNHGSLYHEKGNQLVSQLLMNCAEKDKGIIQMLLTGHTETYDFVLQSEYVWFDQEEIDKYVAPRRSFSQSSGEAVLEKIVRLDQEIYGDQVSPLSVSETEGDALLKQSFYAITNQKPIENK